MGNIIVEKNCIRNCVLIVCAKNKLSSGNGNQKIAYLMVFIIDGSSFHYAHTWSKSGISIWEGIWLHRKRLQIRFFFSKKDLVYIIIIMNQLFSQALMGYWSGKSPMRERVKKV